MKLKPRPRSPAGRAQLVSGYNQQVGVSLLQYARLGRGRRMHILDTTHVEVTLETGTYECSGVGQKRGRDAVRGGDKLARCATLLDSAGLLTASGAVGDSSARYGLVPSLAGGGAGVARWGSAPRRSGLFDGATGSPLEAPTPSRCHHPAQSQYASNEEAIQLAAMADKWEHSLPG